MIVDPDDEVASLKERLRLVTEERDTLKATLQTILGEAESALEWAKLRNSDFLPGIVTRSPSVIAIYL